MPRPRQFNEFDVIGVAIGYFGADTVRLANPPTFDVGVDAS
jgi:hypothetical protein